MKHRVRVGPFPAWIPAQQWLGEGAWELAEQAGSVHANALLETTGAADLAARLRGVVLAGQPVRVETSPPLSRPAVRKGRLDEARRQRDRSPGFSRPGARIDAATRLGLTPEDLALELGDRANKRHVVDICCGAGGNAIGFARAGCSVTAIEIDAARLAMAKHNAAVYGVANRIEWHHGDARTLLPSLQVPTGSLWFVDVPWQSAPVDGSNEKATDDDTAAMRALLSEILALRRPGQPVWAKVPAAFDPAWVPSSQPRAWFGVSPGDARRVKFVILELA